LPVGVFVGDPDRSERLEKILFGRKKFVIRSKHSAAKPLRG
jgi:hypothetical protein